MAAKESKTRPRYHLILIPRRGEAFVHRHPAGPGWDLILRSLRQNPRKFSLDRAYTPQPFAEVPQFVSHVVDVRNQDP